jgi:hypothetical protein
MEKLIRNVGSTSLNLAMGKLSLGTTVYLLRTDTTNLAQRPGGVYGGDSTSAGVKEGV